MGINGPLSTDKRDSMMHISLPSGVVNDVLLLLAYIFIKALKRFSLKCLDINNNCITCEMCRFSFKSTYLR